MHRFLASRRGMQSGSWRFWPLANLRLEVLPPDALGHRFLDFARGCNAPRPMYFFLMALFTQVIYLIMFTCLLLVLLVIWYRRGLQSPAEPHVAVIVLGDIGRSPRMQYHAVSLAKHGCEVSLVGYAGAQPTAEVLSHPRIHLRHIVPWEFPRSLPFTIKAALKVVFLVWGLLKVLLFSAPKFDLLLVQNPPAIPTLVLARIIATLQGASLIIDFHNFGYSLLALKLGEAHPLVQAHLAYETFFGRMADDAFCVTAQMRSRLASEWSVSATPLHDRPASMFRPTPLEGQHALFLSLWDSGLLDRLSDWWPDGRSQTLFTEVSEGQVSRSSSRPHLVISSTSWTPDEDFNQLLDALPALDRDLAKAAKRAVVVVTGKGELRQQFEDRYAAMSQQLKAVRVLTLWLSFKDYALLLGSADLGLSLHTSSSGFDLPMKVVDMFGAGLPACARSFAALPELVRHGENGFTFSSSEELAQSLSHALGVATYDLPQLESAAGQPKLNGWDENWDAVAWPLLQSHLQKSRRKAD
ncbi:unnamed protein product [Durusdinium trenchii]|uniref:Glycosyltransferase subfamily 4-like N-terminal domain-containing protein n=1 Tax=Durusdinium trenchii TaxID=1381693 RepID=A0ABP0L9X5_9DINO